ncbi:hypothetical protein D9619_006675 [Psilocybe cf. subviscida]|uniref:Phosphatidic acid phosphatase type 2/haloperoxidase domain-containing protein n=1 Tax=Psilocybe cf. subviscida TaxID=2480587 RepID=A0A8H5B6J2_9AGAR|nr:hypothetical protein D9619_006675 [Psilocybe cf. subviscida]
MHDGPKASLDLTHVLYDDSSYLSLGLALVTLSPILLMASYAALAVQTREFIIIVMWAGQLVGELLNWVLKHAIKQERPIAWLVSSAALSVSLHLVRGIHLHSQPFMLGSLRLLCKKLMHRFASTGSPILDSLFRLVIYIALAGWTGIVAYSRYYLGYHNPNQIYWGLAIGASLGVPLYIAVEIIPNGYPNSSLGKAKTRLLSSSIVTWLQLTILKATTRSENKVAQSSPRLSVLTTGNAAHVSQKESYRPQVRSEASAQDIMQHKMTLSRISNAFASLN